MDEKSHHSVGPCPWPCLEGGKDSGENALLPNNNITTDSGRNCFSQKSERGNLKIMGFSSTNFKVKIIYVHFLFETTVEYRYVTFQTSPF